MKNHSPQYFEAMEAYDRHMTEHALRLMEDCAEKGDPAACFTTAYWYSEGDGVPKDLRQTARWLKRFEELAQAGDLDAAWSLGQNYRFGNLFQLDIDLANHWLERAARGGHGDAQHHLALYLESGLYGYQRDRIASEKWFQYALDQGHPETLYLFAMRSFQDGKITAKAIELLKEAASKGMLQAADVLREYVG